MKTIVKNPTAGVLWAIAAAASYSLSAVVAKDLVGAMGPASLLFWRFGVAAVALWAVLLVWRSRGGPDPFAVPKTKALGIGVMYGLMVYVGLVAINHLDVSVYIVVVYLYPALVVVASSLLGYFRTSSLVWVSLLVVTSGIVLTVPELFGGVGQVSVIGVVLTLLQACLMAAFMVVSGRLLPDLDGVVQAGWNVLGGTAFVTPIAVFGGVHVPDSLDQTGKLLVFALVSTVLANIAFFRGMRHIAPGVVAMIMTVEVAFDIMWAVVFLGETVRGVKLVGAAVVIAGVLLAQWVSLHGGATAPEVDQEWAATPPVP